VQVVFVDTFHLFQETLDFLADVEARYKFKALVYVAKDFPDVAAYKAVHGSDLPIRDIDECGSCRAVL
jgi:phosphoadenosine phosphosulfate reductase